MFLLGNFRKKYFVGLDLNRESIRLLILNHSAKVRKIESAAEVGLPADIILNERISDSLTLQKILSDLVQRLGIVSYPVAIALPHQHVMAKHINFPMPLSEEECEKEIRTNLSFYLGGVKETVSYDFAPINEEGCDILLVAARQDLIDEYVNLVNQSGLKVYVVDIDTRALLRAASLFTTKTVTAVLTIQAMSAQMWVFQNQNLIFNQRISLTTGNLIHQLKVILQMYFLTHTSVPFDEIVVTGKKMEKDFLESIKKECNLKIVKTNFLDKFTLAQSIDPSSFENIAPQMLMSLGLALRGGADERR